MRQWFTSLSIPVFVLLCGMGPDGAVAFQDSKPVTKGKNVEFREPAEVLGKTFKEWLAELKAFDPSRREAAMNAVVQFGPYRAYEAVPEIILQLNRHKPGQVHIDLSVRVHAVTALSTILTNKPDPGPEAKHLKEAYAIFKTCLKDDQVIMRVRALQALQSVLPYSREAIEDVYKLCKDPTTWEIRREAVQVLGYLAVNDEGEQHAKAMPEMRRIMHADPLIRDSSYQVRMAALETIAMLAQDKVPPELRKALDDPAPPVRYTALTILARMGPLMDIKDKEVTLVKLNAHLATEKDPIIDVWTHATIMTVSKNISAIHMGPVVKKLKDKDSTAKLQALQVINSAGPKGKLFALSGVLEAIEDPEPEFATSAMVTLVHMHALEAIPALEKIAANKKADERVQTAADQTVKMLRSNEKSLTEKKDKTDLKKPLK